VSGDSSAGAFRAQVYVAPRGWVTVGAFGTRAAAARCAAQAFVRTVDGQPVSQVRVVCGDADADLG
jgi:hypothetical protein